MMCWLGCVSGGLRDNLRTNCHDVLGISRVNNHFNFRKRSWSACRNLFSVYIRFSLNINSRTKRCGNSVIIWRVLQCRKVYRKSHNRYDINVSGDFRRLSAVIAAYLEEVMVTNKWCLTLSSFWSADVALRICDRSYVKVQETGDVWARHK